MDGKSSSWNPEADFKSWDKMKTLYLDSEEKDDELVTITSAERKEPNRDKGGASTVFGAVELVREKGEASTSQAESKRLFSRT